MKNSSSNARRVRRRILTIACGAALAVMFTVALSQPALADPVTPPAVPESLKVEEGFEAFLVGHAVGTQNYVCLPSGGSFAWTLFTPQATLFSDNGRQIITHFFGPNPEQGGTIRAAWQHSKDTSTVWARASAPPFFDPPFVATGAIPWLLLEKVGILEGAGGDTLTQTRFIHRVNTAGGVAPATGCAMLSDVGGQRFVPYEADYFFYREAVTDGDEENE